MEDRHPPATTPTHVFQAFRHRFPIRTPSWHLAITPYTVNALIKLCLSVIPGHSPNRHSITRRDHSSIPIPELTVRSNLSRLSCWVLSSFIIKLGLSSWTTPEHQLFYFSQELILRGIMILFCLSLPYRFSYSMTPGSSTRSFTAYLVIWPELEAQNSSDLRPSRAREVRGMKKDA
ncbi:hypothetical protein M422DRAFT_251417 [Sphaerobolus stellatus SS14]|uniref:Uncharacterized protein n=1 Tax=Sphaerobolus stellatus (strain SS14) TaxID=990650 RepID=A0A0C9W2H8_SPHS4|nr:hypothetical protein M422DRAFT_251417 [Sphaerobolus stellatus SS14]